RPRRESGLAMSTWPHAGAEACGPVGTPTGGAQPVSTRTASASSVRNRRSTRSGYVDGAAAPVGGSLGERGAPGVHGQHDLLEAAAELGERVLDARRHLGVDDAPDDAVLLELTQLPGERLGVGQRHQATELVEPSRTTEQMLDEGELPRPAQHRDRD